MTADSILTGILEFLFEAFVSLLILIFVGTPAWMLGGLALYVIGMALAIVFGIPILMVYYWVKHRMLTARMGLKRSM